MCETILLLPGVFTNKRIEKLKEYYLASRTDLRLELLALFSPCSLFPEKGDLNERVPPG